MDYTGRLLPVISSPYQIKNNGKVGIVMPISSGRTLTVNDVEQQSYPSTMLGFEYSPSKELNYEQNNVAITNSGIVEFITSIDGSTYSISQDSSPLPLQESYKPSIIKSRYVPYTASSTIQFPNLDSVLEQM